MSKELEALEKIKQNIIDYFDFREISHPEYPDTKRYVEKTYHFDLIEKSLKALEIIKEKKVNVGLLLRCNSVERYNKGICYEPRHLTKEEYELLKEVLL